MRKVRLASLDELPPGTMKTYEVEGRYILLANVGGRMYGMGGICTHEEWDLSEGTLQGEKVVCAGHGAVWDLRTGQAQFTKPLSPLPTYRVIVEGRDIFVEME